MVEADRQFQPGNFQHIIPLPEAARQELCNICAKLPHRLVMRELINIYFVEANWYFAILEQHYFEKLYNSWCSLNDSSAEHGQVADVPPDLLHFSALIFHVLAVSLQFVSPDTNCSRALGVDSFNARDHLSSNFSTSGVEIARILGTLDPTITAVQNDLMRALWLKNCSRGREAWHALGGAIRSVPAYSKKKKAIFSPQPERPKILASISRAKFIKHHNLHWRKRSLSCGMMSTNAGYGSSCSPGTGEASLFLL